MIAGGAFLALIFGIGVVCLLSCTPYTLISKAHSQRYMLPAAVIVQYSTDHLCATQSCLAAPSCISVAQRTREVRLYQVGSDLFVAAHLPMHFCASQTHQFSVNTQRFEIGVCGPGSGPRSGQTALTRCSTRSAPLRTREAT